MNIKPKFKVEVNGAAEGGYGIIKLFDDQGNVLDIGATKSNKDYSASDLRKDMYKKVLQMILEADPNIIDHPQAMEIFKLLNISFTMDGKRFI